MYNLSTVRNYKRHNKNSPMENLLYYTEESIHYITEGAGLVAIIIAIIGAIILIIGLIIKAIISSKSGSAGGGTGSSSVESAKEQFNKCSTIYEVGEKLNKFISAKCKQNAEYTDSDSIKSGYLNSTIAGIDKNNITKLNTIIKTMESHTPDKYDDLDNKSIRVLAIELDKLKDNFNIFGSRSADLNATIKTYTDVVYDSTTTSYKDDASVGETTPYNEINDAISDVMHDKFKNEKLFKEDCIIDENDYKDIIALGKGCKDEVEVATRNTGSSFLSGNDNDITEDSLKKSYLYILEKFNNSESSFKELTTSLDKVRSKFEKATDKSKSITTTHLTIKPESLDKNGLDGYYVFKDDSEKIYISKKSDAISTLYNVSVETDATTLAVTDIKKETINTVSTVQVSSVKEFLKTKTIYSANEIKATLFVSALKQYLNITKAILDNALKFIAPMAKDAKDVCSYIYYAANAVEKYKLK